MKEKYKKGDIIVFYAKIRNQDIEEIKFNSPQKKLLKFMMDM